MLEVTEEVGMLQVMDQDRRHGVVVHLQGLKLLSKDSGLRVEVVVMLLVEVCYNFRLFENINARYQQIKYIQVLVEEPNQALEPPPLNKITVKRF